MLHFIDKKARYKKKAAPAKGRLLLIKCINY